MRHSSASQAAHGAVVADRRAGSHLYPLAAVDVQHRAVLHVRAGADDDRLEVGPDDRVVPDRRALLDRDVADNDGRRGDERGGMHARRFPSKLNSGMGCALAVSSDCPHLT